ncbi:VOC family protein [Gordonia sp. NPDC003376]
MSSPRTPVSAATASDEVAEPWRVIADALQAAYRTRNMVTGGKFVARVIEAAEAADHHPDVDLRYGSVHFTVSTHSSRRLTAADVALANAIAGIADEMGLEPLAAPPARFDVAIDTADAERIRPFWRAVLGYRDDPEHTLADLTDPDGILPPVWFQQLDLPRPERSRTHVDLWVPHDVVADRIQAGLDAGGRLVTDEFAPGWWVLADAEGNEICLCTWQDREEDGA